MPALASVWARAQHNAPDATYAAQAGELLTQVDTEHKGGALGHYLTGYATSSSSPSRQTSARLGAGGIGRPPRRARRLPSQSAAGLPREQQSGQRKSDRAFSVEDPGSVFGAAMTQGLLAS